MHARLTATATLALLLAAAAACARPAVPPRTDPLTVYAALLADTAASVPDSAALSAQLMSDTGTYEPSGLMDEVTVRMLLGLGLVREVCGDGPVRDGIRECVTHHAGTEIRLSRPLAGAGDTVMVYLGRGTVYPEGDTTSLKMYVGMTQRCHLVPREGRWRVARCDVTTVT